MKKTSTLIWRVLRAMKISRLNKGSSPKFVIGDLPRTAVTKSTTTTTSVEDSRLRLSGMTLYFYFFAVAV